MASSKPVIAFYEGAKEIIVNDAFFFLVNSMDKMASKMVFLAERPGVAVDMGLEGKEIVEKRFSPSFFSEIDGILDNVPPSRNSHRM